MICKDHQLSQRKQAELLSVWRTGKYYKPRGETALNQRLMNIIDRQYTATPFYGVPRMTDFINRHYFDLQVNKKRVRRLYKLLDIRAVGPNPYTSKSDPVAYKYPYLLKNLIIKKANQVWVSDITYIGMRKGFMYLYAIMDLFSRYILNWGLSNTMTAKWCAEITKEAFLLHPLPEIFNTDQGSQFTSDTFTGLLESNEIKISMDGKGRAVDNIFIERFWRSIKQEYVYLNPPNGGYELYQGIEEYIRFYNYERGHQMLDRKPPAELYYGKKINFKSTKYLTTVV